MKKTNWPGNWKVCCHVCGFWFPSGEIKKRWDGLLVCSKDYEARHPQEFLRVPPERIVPAFVSPKEPEMFVGPAYDNPLFGECNLLNSRGIADIGVAGCMTPGVLV